MYATMYQWNQIFSRYKLNASMTFTTHGDEALLDVKVNGLGESRLTRTYFDVKVFTPKLNAVPKATQTYKYHETIKKAITKNTSSVEKSTCCPLIFSGTGGPTHRLPKQSNDLPASSATRKIDHTRISCRSSERILASAC